MRKKGLIFIIPLLYSFTAISQNSGGEANPGSDSFQSGHVVLADEAQADTKIGDQYSVEGNWVPATEVNDVEESETARKMAQAKKAENAKTYDKYGGGITIISMCIVITALVVLSLLFLFFGKISSWFFSHKKKQIAAKTAGKRKEAEGDDDHSPDTGEAIAAIAAALAQHFSIDHDREDTILTIKRMRKAYSPWNSKIYNMRHTPEISHSSSLKRK